MRARRAKIAAVHSLCNEIPEGNDMVVTSPGQELCCKPRAMIDGISPVQTTRGDLHLFVPCRLRMLSRKCSWGLGFLAIGLACHWF